MIRDRIPRLTIWFRPASQRKPSLRLVAPLSAYLQIQVLQARLNPGGYLPTMRGLILTEWEQQVAIGSGRDPCPRSSSFWTACSLFGSRVYYGGFGRGRKTAENVVLGDEETTMALVLNGCGGPGRIADDSVFAWKSSSDGYADQDPCRAGLGNEHAPSDTHAPA